MRRQSNRGDIARLFLTLSLLALGVAACGGGNGRLSKATYRSHLATISKQADAAHRALAGAKTVAAVQAVLRRFAAAESRLGDELSKLKAPADAEAANAALARAELDDAAEIRATIPKLSRFKTVEQAFAFLQRIGDTKGGREQDEALATLGRLGYTTGS